MSKRNVLRPIVLILCALGAAWLVASCSTTPKPTTPTPIEPTKTLPDTTTKTTQEPVSAEAFLAAEKAISEAEEADAATYSADLLGEAKKALADARDKADAEPDAARALLKTSIEKAHTARDQAWAAQLAKLDADAQAAITEAVDADAESLAPEPLAQARQAVTDARQQTPTAPAAAKASYLEAIAKAHEARDAAKMARDKNLKAELAQLDQEALDAIAEAEATEADRYAPQPLGVARKSLAEGRDKTESDPQAARIAYGTSIAKAHEARDAAAAGRSQALIDRVETALTRWKALSPDKWDPEGSAPIAEQAEAAKVAVHDNYTSGLPLATEALTVLEESTAQWSARLLAVQDLRVRAQQALDGAEAADAFIWVPDLIQAANDAFFQGTSAWKKFRLDAAEEAWSTAEFQAKSATGKAEAERERKRTEQLMLDTMKKLEAASGKTVVDPQDNIIAPKPWDGQKELDKLKKKPVSKLIPADGSVVVLGDVQRVTYLDEAKDQWAQGVKALDAGDLTLANESFLQAQKLIDTYLALAVDKIYTVRLIPDRSDSLWRISEYGDIYATPWDWPKIWKRNQKLIQNPDLIYPGWQLIIPPQ